jgi:SAM-dependent methyltransferase
LNLQRLQWHWNRFGLRDPLWAVLTHPEKKNRGWDREEFFRTGVSEVDAVLRYVESIHPLIRKNHALDFGCGVGRVTQALSTHFERVIGVDIAPSMIEHARDYNRHGSRCEYLLNDKPDLCMFTDCQFDFIYSNMTLQHMPPRLSKAYLVEFLRVLAPGGLLLFQLPSRIRKDQSTAIERIVRRLYYDLFRNFLRPGTPYMEMHGANKEDVVPFLEQHGGKVLDVTPDDYAQPYWEGFRYLAVALRKPPSIP